MEPAKIDWKRVTLEWNFVEDELYEQINAPKWVDFLSRDHSLNDVDDEAWFCRPGSNHFLLFLSFFFFQHNSQLGLPKYAFFFTLLIVLLIWLLLLLLMLQIASIPRQQRIFSDQQLLPRFFSFLSSHILSFYI